MKKVDGETLEKLIEYHHFHGDTNVQCRRVYTDHHGFDHYLMRFGNEQGVKYSSIDTLMPGKDEAYVTEMFSAKREDEKKMIEQALRIINAEDDDA